MCAAGNGTMLPYNLNVKIPHPTPYIQIPPTGMSQAAIDLQRMQLLDYSARLRYGLASLPHAAHPLAALYHPHAVADPLTQAYFLHKHDPRARFVHEEPKPSHSYIGLIAMAILGSKEKKLVLSDIYQWILDNYAYFRTRGPGWRNSIRHNLSLNDCFIKSGRSANGKGHYWAVHPANVEDFQKGDFRRRRAQRKVRKHMGLAVPDDDEDDDSPPPSNIPSAPMWQAGSPEDCRRSPSVLSDKEVDISVESHEDNENTNKSVSGVVNLPPSVPVNFPSVTQNVQRISGPSNPSKRRLFDVESLLAPEPKVARIGVDINNCVDVKSVISPSSSVESSPEDLSLNGGKVSPKETISQQTPSPRPRSDADPERAGLLGIRAPLGAPFGAFPGGFQPSFTSPWRAVARPGMPLPTAVPNMDISQTKQVPSKWNEPSQTITKSPVVIHDEN